MQNNNLTFKVMNKKTIILEGVFETLADYPKMTPELSQYNNGGIKTVEVINSMLKNYGKMAPLDKPFRLSYLAQKIKDSGVKESEILFKCNVLIIMSTFYRPFMRINNNKFIQI
jgi:hypothetical protein